jgi:hypothetical protein
MRLNDMRLDIALDEILEIHDVLEKMVNLLSLNDQIHAALHSEQPHKSPLTLKAEEAREVVAGWVRPFVMKTSVNDFFVTYQLDA